MKRRTLLRTAAALPLAANVQVGQTPPTATPARDGLPKLALESPDAAGAGVPRFFSPDEFQALRRLGDLLMPASSETPGSSDAGAAEFLDFLISRSDADRQTLYRSGLVELNRRSRLEWNKSFSEAGDAATLLEPLSRPWSYAPPSDPFERFLRVAKDDFWTATLNSRQWAQASSRRRAASGVGLYWDAIE